MWYLTADCCICASRACPPALGCKRRMALTRYHPRGAGAGVWALRWEAGHAGCMAACTPYSPWCCPLITCVTVPTFGADPTPGPRKSRIMRLLQFWPSVRGDLLFPAYQVYTWCTQRFKARRGRAPPAHLLEGVEGVCRQHLSPLVAVGRGRELGQQKRSP